MAAYSDNMYGVVNGLYECNNGRLEQINNRISNRNIPSSILQPQFSSRPVSTKYALLPIVDRRPVAKEPLVQAPPFNIKQTFNPGTQGPWSGFAKHVNDESILKNQIFALQRSSQSVWVPSSNSDLYENHLPPMDSGLLMFKKLPPQENTSKPPNEKSYWNNHTRNDILDIY